MPSSNRWAHCLFPNTFYTSPTYFQWGILAIISLKSSVLKASKGRREIRDTNPFLLIFRVRHFVWRARISKGERGRRLVTSEKLNFYIFVLLWLKSTRHLLPHNVTEDSVFVIHHLVLFYYLLLFIFVPSCESRQTKWLRDFVKYLPNFGRPNL